MLTERPAPMLRSALAAFVCTLTLAFVCSLALAPPAFAQEAVLQIAQGPYYTGSPIDMQVVADGFEEDPTPDVTPTPPTGATLTFVQARPQVSSMMQIINGRVTQSHTVRFGFVYQFTAQAAGRYTVGPFTVTQNGKTATTAVRSITVADVPEGSGQKIRVVFPDRPIVVGQRVPVTVEWWTERGLADRLYDEHLTVPLFLDTTNFQFLDEAHDKSRITINTEMPGGTAEVPADVRQTSEGGREWVIRSFSRTMIPVAAGHFDLGQPALYCDEALAFRRDLFGSRVPSQTRKVRISGDSIVLDVHNVPAAGRPASFAGAIGQGFTMDVAADRTVLQTGDPVKLTFTIHGDGSLDSASLPPLDAAGLSAKQFRLPDGDVAGISDAAGKHFDVTVRVIDPSVREIPPIEYSWFNPETGKFESTHSKPIALSVKAATVVGAGDVVSAAPPEKREEQKKEAAKPAAAGRAPAFTLTGADLSIETDAARLRSPATSLLGSPAVTWSGYGLGILAMGAGLFVRRRRSIDPVKAKLRRDLRDLRGHVAFDRNPKKIADALRKMAALTVRDGARPAQLDDVLAGLDETAFAPGGSDAIITEVLRNEAVSVADSLMEQAR
jgi:hypothetical protein